jgi:NhaP-type Na+/H+ or K+/H+ antiporter
MPTIEVLVLLLAVAAAAAVIANRLKIAAAIVLVVTGVVLALIPWLPTVPLAPDLVLLIVLPPVIYSGPTAALGAENARRRPPLPSGNVRK